MKKTIVLIILAVYIASIAVVNFFGLQVRIFDGVTYVTGIQCESITFHGQNSQEIIATLKPGKDPMFVFDFIPSTGDPYTKDPESIEKNPNVIQLNYVVQPLVADDSVVKFEYDMNSDIAVYNEHYGYFIFLQPDHEFYITIRATDGSNVSTRIIIFARDPQQNG